LSTKAPEPATKAEVKQGRELIEGGDFKCDIEGHGNIRTADPIEWRKHCRETGHLLGGEAPCLYCGTKVIGEFPYPDEGQPIGAICPACLEKHVKPALAMAEKNAAAAKAKAAPTEGAKK
jgi:hypothetical protein